MNLWFIWIPKNAGTSIWSVLRRWGGVRYGNRKSSVPYREFPNCGVFTFGHFSPDVLLQKQIVSETCHQCVPSFAVVRNPYDRLVSAAAHSVQRWKERKKPRTLEQEIASRCRELADGYPHRIGLYDAYRSSNLQPQSRWIYDEHGHQIPDRILRFEQLRRDWRRLCHDLNRPVVPLPWKRRSQRPPTGAVLRAEQKRIIRRWYAEDFARWGGPQWTC